MAVTNLENPHQHTGAEYTSRQIEILEVAGQQFARLGFAGTDVQYIADSVGVGKGTVYREFGNKDALFLAAVDRENQLLLARVTDASEAAATPFAQVEAVVHAYLTFFDERPWAAELMILERATFRDRTVSTYFQYLESSRSYWERLFDQLRSENTIRDVSPSDAMNIFSDVLYGAMFTNHFAGHQEPYVDKAPLIMDVLMNGMLLRSSD